jgi:hypothetical protein
VLGNIPLMAKTELHLAPIPPAANIGIFTPGPTSYGVIDAGYKCARCETEVKGGMGKVPHVHRFDYCGCTMVIRSPESVWNQLLIEDFEWKELCIGSIEMVRKQLGERESTCEHYRFKRAFVGTCRQVGPGRAG